MAEAASKLPINIKTFTTYCKKLGIYKPNQSGKGTNKVRPCIPLQEILEGLHPQYQTYKLKNRLISEGIFSAICSSCNFTEWLNDPIPLELDHIDGNPFNHRLINLRLLCPNCHAKTPTYRAKNKR
jgi:ribosomal protein L44E